MARSRRRLQLVGASRSEARGRSVLAPRRPSKLRIVIDGLLMVAAGVGLLVGLFLLRDRLDTLLLVSTAIANLLGGLTKLILGVLQLLGGLLVVGAALVALVLLVAGALRLGRGLLLSRRRRAPASGPRT